MFECPRCHKETEQSLYGPCEDCREYLRNNMMRNPELPPVQYPLNDRE